MKSYILNPLLVLKGDRFDWSGFSAENSPSVIFLSPRYPIETDDRFTDNCANQDSRVVDQTPDITDRTLDGSGFSEEGEPQFLHTR